MKARYAARCRAGLFCFVALDGKIRVGEEISWVKKVGGTHAGACADAVAKSEFAARETELFDGEPTSDLFEPELPWGEQQSQVDWLERAR